MSRSFGELLTHRGHVAETAQRLGPCLVWCRAEKLKLVGARCDMGRDFIVQLPVELIAPQRRVTKEPAKATTHDTATRVCGSRA